MAFFLLAMLPYSSSQITNAQVADAADSACMDKIDRDIFKMGSEMDVNKAIAAAVADTEVNAKMSGYKSSFGSTFGTWTYDSNTCTAEWKDANVVYFLSDPGSNEYVKVVSVALDPSLSKIISVDEYPAQYSSSNHNYTNWAGYQFYGNSGATKTLLQSKATWTLPSVSEPWTNACSFHHCDLAVWVGLVNSLGASNGNLVQSGSDSGIYCTIGCSFFYYGWYELLPAPMVKCNNLNMVPGDTMRSYTYNQAKDGGSSSQYAFVVEDLTKSTVCGAVNQNYSQMTAPKYGTFIDERPYFSDCGCDARLPKFTSDTMTSATIYYDGAEKSIYTPPYTSGWYDKVKMVNSGVINVDVANVLSAGSFKMTWKTSNNT
jgi:hypothetical protein